MPDLVEQLFSHHQIIIPPNLPTILKKYAKAAIRTQPNDLLVWSVAYFKALTYGIPIPTKERIEYPPVETISGLTPGFLRVLINQLGDSIVTVSRDDVIDYWKGICLSQEALEEIFAVGGFGLKLNWLKFIAICAGYLEKNLTRTMILLCKLLTDEPMGGSEHIPVNKFLYLYKYLARLECGPEEPKKFTSDKILLSPDDEAETQIMSGEGIHYNGEEESSMRSGSPISWQSVLKRMAKRDSDISGSTIDPDKICSKKDYLSRGIAWKRIQDIGESEPDTSMTQSDHGDGCSSLGLQVFDHPGEDNEEQKLRRIFMKKELDEEESSIHLSKSEALIDVTEGLGEKTLDELLGFIQELETTTAIKLAGEAYSDDEVIVDDKPNIQEKEKSKTNTIISQRSDTDASTNKSDFELNVLVKPDSSIILVPTPPGIDEPPDSIDSIEELKDEEASFGEPLKQVFSLHDVRIPMMDIPTTLIRIEDEKIPRTFVQEQKWVYIPGIGSKVSEEQIKEVVNYMKDCAEKQGGAVMPRNIRHFLCPPLDPFETKFTN